MPRHNNSFDIIRHAAAIAVLISHHYALNGMVEPLVLGMESLGSFSVIAFFSISGYLITASWMRSDSITSYYSKRIRRIFPALIVCSFIMVFVLFPIFGNGDFASYIFSYKSIYSFICFSLLSIKHTFTNGFADGYIYNGIANGSLWTLKFEFFDYILISIVFLSKKKPIVKALIILALSIAASKLNGSLIAENYYIERASMLTIPFITGALIYLLGDKTLVNTRLLALLAFSFMLFSSYIDSHQAFLVSSACLFVLLGKSVSENLISGKFDISYGIYIYAFPVQQIIINETSLSFIASLILSILTTTVCAITSWFIVEKKFLNRNLPKA